MIPEHWADYPAWRDLPIDERRKTYEPLLARLAQLRAAVLHGRRLVLLRRILEQREPVRRLMVAIFGAKAA